MSEYCPIVNPSTELSECRAKWFLDDKYGCWCLEDVLYVPAEKARVPRFQRLSIFVPREYMSAPGIIDCKGLRGGYTASVAPVVFENNAAGYMQMPHAWLGGPRCYAEPYLAHGMIYITCGCRGRESRDASGHAAGKAPWTLVDLKTAIRFLRHNRASIPGDLDRIISIGWSAGGAMSTLLSVTGNHPRYNPYLEENGAFMEESDAVFAAQIYCPIIDLEHADLAYEWMFRADLECEDSPAGPAETMTPFKKALSGELSARYIEYIDAMGLTHPETGAPLKLGPDGRSGGFYDYLMTCLNHSAEDYLRRLEAGTLVEKWSVQDYLAGNYTHEIPAPMPKPPKDAPPPPALGEMLSRPPKGVQFPEFKPLTMTVSGDAKPWLCWDGKNAEIDGLDTYVLRHRRRMKPCTSFDKLPCDSGENQEFGNEQEDFVHFNPLIGDAIAALAEEYPEEAARYQESFARCLTCDSAPFDGATALRPSLEERIFLLNPLNFIGTPDAAQSTQARHYRIRVGAADADTSLSVSMTLALRLMNANAGSVDYAMVWDQPHSEADYPGEVLEWIDSLWRKTQ